MCEKQGEQITFDAKLISFTRVTKSNWKILLISIRKPRVAKWPGTGERKKIDIPRNAQKRPVFSCF